MNVVSTEWANPQSLNSVKYDKQIKLSICSILFSKNHVSSSPKGHDNKLQQIFKKSAFCHQNYYNYIGNWEESLCGLLNLWLALLYKQTKLNSVNMEVWRAWKSSHRSFRSKGAFTLLWHGSQLLRKRFKHWPQARIHGHNATYDTSLHIVGLTSLIRTTDIQNNLWELKYYGRL